MKKYFIGLILGLGLLANYASSATLQAFQGGTGFSTSTSASDNLCLAQASSSPFLTWKIVACGGGGSVSTSSPITAFNFPYWANTIGGLMGSSTLFYSSSTGYIGIGTTGPGTKLEVVGVTSSTEIRTASTTGGVGYFTQLYDSGATSTECETGTGTFGQIVAGNCVVTLNNLHGNVIATGTTGQIGVSSSSGNLVFSLPTTINATNLNLSGTLGVSSTATFAGTVTAQGILQDASGNKYSTSTGGLSSYAVSVTTANGVSATAATTTTSTALTFSLGAITPSTVNGLALSLGANSVPTNVAVGAGALASSSLSGNYNTANGYQSLYNNTTGSNNTANGDYSLYNNTTGGYNTANGYESLFYNTTGNYNTANGYQSLYNNTTSSNNTANGDYSLYNNTTGGNNTANGYYSLYNNTTSSNSVALGYYAGYNSTIPNAFYVGNVQQFSAANDKSYSLLYGNFSGVAASLTGQQLTVNGTINTPLGINASGTINSSTTVTISGVACITTSTVSINGTSGNVFTGLSTSTPSIATTTKSVYDMAPSSTDDIVMMYTESPFTIKQVDCVNDNVAGNSVAFNIIHGSTRASTTSLLFTQAIVCNTTTTILSTTTFANASILAGEIIRFVPSTTAANVSSTGIYVDFKF